MNDAKPTKKDLLKLYGVQEVGGCECDPATRHEVAAGNEMMWGIFEPGCGSGPAFENTDDAPAELVLAAVRQCAEAWVPDARLVGSVRAGDIARAMTVALTAMGSALA